MPSFGYEEFTGKKWSAAAKPSINLAPEQFATSAACWELVKHDRLRIQFQILVF